MAFLVDVKCTETVKKSADDLGITCEPIYSTELNYALLMPLILDYADKLSVKEIVSLCKKNLKYGLKKPDALGGDKLEASDCTETAITDAIKKLKS